MKKKTLKRKKDEEVLLLVIILLLSALLLIILQSKKTEKPEYIEESILDIQKKELEDIKEKRNYTPPSPEEVERQKEEMDILKNIDN